MTNNVVDVLDEAARAYEFLIGAGDRVGLTPEEIRRLADAMNGLEKGQSFLVTVEATAGPAYCRRVEVPFD